MERKGRPKNQVKIVNNEKNLENLVKNWYYMHFEPKKYTKNYKMSVIQNKEDMIRYYQLKKNWTKSMRGPKIRSKSSKNEKI